MTGRPARALLALAAALALGGGAARGDVIFQPGGGKIVGEIVEEKDDYVAIKTKGGGVLRVSRDEIDRIERGAVPPAEPVPVEPKADPKPAAEKRPPAPKPAEPKPEAAKPPPKPEEEKPAAPKPDADETTEAAPATPKPDEAAPKAASGAKSAGASALATDEEALLKPRTRAVLDWFERHKADLRARLAPLLKQRRQEALSLINDPRRYPDANHGAAAQPEVDRLVDALRRVWQDPFAEALELSPELRRLAAELADVAADDGAEVRAKVNRALSFRDAPAADEHGAEDARAVTAQNARAKTTADEEERACVDATNRYRAMYGLRLLRLDERLVQAARKHSKAMVELHFFDHVSPLKGLEQPSQRCAAEGATYSAENIAYGSRSGEQTFLEWYNSSGHHRNLLGDHLSIGIGRFETHWTQDFGKDTPKAN
jgi:uncharacterized protein YkwD